MEAMVKDDGYGEGFAGALEELVGSTEIVRLTKFPDMLPKYRLKWLACHMSCIAARVLSLLGFGSDFTEKIRH